MSFMQAARLHKIGGQFTIDQLPIPEPGSHDVLIRVVASAVIPNLKNVTTHFPEWYPFLPLPELPAIFGLDSAGVVESVGSAVNSFQPGDRVYVNPGIGCGQCRFCNQGDATRCNAYTFMGYFGFGAGSKDIFKRYPYAGYGQYMTAPCTSLVRLPDCLSFANATRLGYLGTAYSAIRKSQLRPSQSIMILGASGTLGVGATLLALAFGASRVVVVARDTEALERLRALDPHRIIAIQINEQPIDQQIRAYIASGVDVMLDTLGAKAPAQLSVEAMRAVSRGGRIVQIGGVAGPIPIDPHPFMCAQLQYIGSLWFTPSEGAEMVALFESGILDFSLLEQHSYPLEKLNQALEDIQAQGNGFTNFHILHE
ncbi:alcohol dehydrogenase catalytic domain-containing protein [Denitrificimonas caeni]|uniref:alcohol dehydrogenase catalytic domain-containing protein n=1 Tax=Denitrificimonas caeni TaxID=521720 RepID=UPI00196698FB|nr:zinc-binding dehydrogenase [Denitrificimonas caeni]